MPECTSQIGSIDIWVLLQIIYDAAILVPGRYQAKVGNGSRYPVEREKVIVFDLLHQHHLLAKPLCYASDRRKVALPLRDRETCLHFWSSVREDHLEAP